MMTTTDKRELAERKWHEGSALEDAGEIAQAIRVYRIGAKLGSDSAQNNLANLLDDYATPRRPAEAVYWYKRAARQGHDTAAENLAVHYRNLGKTRWQKHWLAVAAKMGNRDAAKELRVLERRQSRR